jgi:hypothetical protein
VGKYDGLAVLLQAKRGSRVLLAFDEVASVVPGGLPPSAHQYSAWWSNEAAGSHVQARAWMNSGWRVEAVDLHGRTVTFTRMSGYS